MLLEEEEGDGVAVGVDDGVTDTDDDSFTHLDPVTFSLSFSECSPPLLSTFNLLLSLLLLELSKDDDLLCEDDEGDLWVLSEEEVVLELELVDDPLPPPPEGSGGRISNWPVSGLIR